MFDPPAGGSSAETEYLQANDALCFTARDGEIAKILVNFIVSCYNILLCIVPNLTLLQT